MDVIRCVIWDCFNVLIHYDTPVLFAFFEKYRGNNLPPEAIFSGRGLELVKNYDLGRISSDIFFRGIKELFELSDEIDREKFFEVVSSTMHPDREALAIRDNLIKKGVPTALISNMSDFNVEYIMKNCPEFLEGYDCKFISCDEGVGKPDPEAWIRTLDRLGMKAEECLFIDDSFHNIDTALGLGINVWYYQVTDSSYCHNGKLDKERKRLGEFLDFLWNIRILKPR